MVISTYKSKFGLLTIEQGPEDNFVWTVNVHVSNNLYTGKIPIYILTNERIIPNSVIELAETIVLNIEVYLEKSILFIKKTLTEQQEKYKIREDEYDFLSLNVEDFPVDFPELTFWEDSMEWVIRFAEGRFHICDPLGISVTYNLTNPIDVDNLEDSEYIDIDD